MGRPPTTAGKENCSLSFPGAVRAPGTERVSTAAPLTFGFEGSLIGRLLLAAAVALRLHVLGEAGIQAQQGTPGCQDLAADGAAVTQLWMQLGHGGREGGLLQEAGRPVPVPQLGGRGGGCAAALGQGLWLVGEQGLQPLFW